ncbi:MAG: hypothetical protein AB1942_03630 [Pseudomonadota bacterium]
MCAQAGGERVHLLLAVFDEAGEQALLARGRISPGFFDSQAT